MGIIPTDWSRGIIFPTLNRKDDTKKCNNYYESYTFSSMLGKVQARIIRGRARQKLLTNSVVRPSVAEAPY